MAISAINSVDLNSAINNIDYISTIKNTDSTKTTGPSFDSVFESIVGMIDETNQLTNLAEEEEIKYAMGEDNTLELMVAQNKANISLSYTVAVRDKLLEAYREIMNMQF